MYAQTRPRVAPRTVLTSRTLAGVERSLASLSINTGREAMNKETSYLSCRYDPFNAGKSQGPPDGIGRNLTTRDYIGTYDLVTPTNQGCEIMILPTLPMQVAVRSRNEAGVMSVNGVNVTRATVARPEGAWTPFGPTTMRALRNPITTIDNTNAIASGRIITVGYRIYYTGAASLCQGILQADVSPAVVDVEAELHPAAIATYNLVGNAGPVIAENTTNVIKIDMESSGTYTTQNSCLMRPEAGMHGVLPRKVKAEAHRFKTFHEIACVPIGDSNTPTNMATTSSASLFQGSYTDLEATSYPGVSMWDDDFNPIKITINTTVSLSFRLEVITCVQFEHNNTFSLISLTTKPVESNEKVLEVDNKLSGSTVAGQPLGIPAFTINNSITAGTKGRRNRKRKNNANNTVHPTPKARGNPRPRTNRTRVGRTKVNAIVTTSN